MVVRPLVAGTVCQLAGTATVAALDGGVACATGVAVPDTAAVSDGYGVNAAGANSTPTATRARGPACAPEIWTCKVLPMVSPILPLTICLHLCARISLM